MNRCFIKKMRVFIVLCLCFAALFASGVYAEAKSLKPITVIIPIEAINHMMEGALPLEIPMGPNFSGALRIQTIEKLKISKNRVTFFMRVLGEDIEFSTKIGSQVLNLKFGEANVSSNSEASFRYDKEKKLLYIIPRISEFIDTEKSGQAGEVLMPLLEGLSNIEYAVDLNKIEPLKGELQDKVLLVHFDFVDIYSENNQFYVKIIPSTETTPKK